MRVTFSFDMHPDEIPSGELAEALRCGRRSGILEEGGAALVIANHPACRGYIEWSIEEHPHLTQVDREGRTLVHVEEGDLVGRYTSPTGPPIVEIVNRRPGLFGRTRLQLRVEGQETLVPISSTAEGRFRVWR